jgi:hypothetical protein
VVIDRIFATRTIMAFLSDEWTDHLTKQTQILQGMWGSFWSPKNSGGHRSSVSASKAIALQAA